MKVPAGMQMLHEMVESLSAALEVPVELTDARLNPLSRSSPDVLGAGHGKRAISPRRMGIEPGAQLDLSNPVSVPSVEILGMPGFSVLPLRVEERLVALLWLTWVNGDLAPGRIKHAERIAQATVAALDALSVFDEAQWTEGEISTRLLSGDLRQIEAAVQEQVGIGKLTHDDRSLALGVSLTPRQQYVGGDEIEHRLRAMIRRLAALYPDRRRLVAQLGHEALLLVAPYPNESIGVLAEKLSTFAMDILFRSWGERGSDPYSWLVAMSEPQGSIDRAGEAIWQAQQMLAMGRRLGWSNRSVDWAAVAHLRGLSTVPAHSLQSDFISPALREFLTDPELRELRLTLERYLLNAGSVQKVAAESYLHRATVYHRLKRIEDILGIDLGNGHDRLEVHLGLVAWRVLHHP